MQEKTNKYAPKIDGEVDLHGLYQKEALERVEEFIERSLEVDYKRIRIITGKGSGVLQKTIRTWLQEKNHFYETAKITEGGSGALIVHL